MPKRLLLICNPKAGRGLTPERMMQMLRFYSAREYLVEVYLTKKKGDLSELSPMLAEADRIVCSGGDGMVNQLVNLLLHHPELDVPAFGYLPAGTTNDFARSLGIPTVFASALLASVSPRLRQMDAGCLNGRYFMYVAGFGLFTDVSYRTPQKQKNALGYLAYILQGVKSLSELKPLHLCIEVAGRAGAEASAAAASDGVTAGNGMMGSNGNNGQSEEGGVGPEQIEGDFILGMVTNSLSVAGMKMMASADTAFNDGLFEMILIRNPENVFALSELLSAVLTSNLNDPHIVYRQGSQFRFTGEKLSWTLDGEYGGAYEETEIAVAQGAMHIAVPELPGRPQKT